MIVLDADLTIVSISPEAEQWLAGLDDHEHELPVAVRAAALQLQRLNELPTGVSAEVLRLRTRSGRWLAVHASTLRGAVEQTAVVIEPATSAQLGSLLLDVHALTPAQQRVTDLVLRGRSTPADRRRAASVAAHGPGARARGVRQGRRRQSTRTHRSTPG
nr:hypothetical protein [Kribbella qitaiheensis]